MTWEAWDLFWKTFMKVEFVQNLMAVGFICGCIAATMFFGSMMFNGGFYKRYLIELRAWQSIRSFSTRPFAAMFGLTFIVCRFIGALWVGIYVFTVVFSFILNLGFRY